jgi:hypothetical protein
MFSGCPYIYGNLEQATQFSQQGLIDNLDYLNRNKSKAYIFQGIVDPIVPWRKFYTHTTVHIDSIKIKLLSELEIHKILCNSSRQTDT